MSASRPPSNTNRRSLDEGGGPTCSASRSRPSTSARAAASSRRDGSGERERRDSSRDLRHDSPRRPKRRGTTEDDEHASQTQISGHPRRRLGIRERNTESTFGPQPGQSQALRRSARVHQRREDLGGSRRRRRAVGSAVAWVNERLHVGCAIFHGEGGVLECVDLVQELAGRYQLAELVYDPWRFGQAAQELAQRGIPVVEFPQTDQRMIPASNRLHEAITESRLLVRTTRSYERMRPTPWPSTAAEGGGSTSRARRSTSTRSSPSAWRSSRRSSRRRSSSSSDGCEAVPGLREADRQGLPLPRLPAQAGRPRRAAEASRMAAHQAAPNASRSSLHELRRGHGPFTCITRPMGAWWCSVGRATATSTAEGRRPLSGHWRVDGHFPGKGGSGGRSRHLLPPPSAARPATPPQNPRKNQRERDCLLLPRAVDSETGQLSGEYRRTRSPAQPNAPRAARVRARAFCAAR
jgi:hypothetical protein